MQSLGKYAKTLVMPLTDETRDVATVARCIFAGDFNLAPTASLMPSPVVGGVDAFSQLNEAGWIAANVRHTNLLELAKRNMHEHLGPQKLAARHGKVYDNFFVHDALCHPDEVEFAGSQLNLQLVRFHRRNDRAANAFVVHLDKLLLAQAATMSVPVEWLKDGFCSANQDPHQWLLTALLDDKVLPARAARNAPTGE